jgi:hypothetical protein
VTVHHRHVRVRAVLFSTEYFTLLEIRNTQRINCV